MTRKRDWAQAYESPAPDSTKGPPPLPEHREAIAAEGYRWKEGPTGAGCLMYFFGLVAAFSLLGALVSIPQGAAAFAVLFTICVLAALGMVLIHIWTEVWKRGERQ